MRPLHELIRIDDRAFPLIREWADRAVRPIEILSPSDQRSDVLRRTQVTTRSTLGAVAYETGGIVVDGGWLRILGSGHPRLQRTLPDWNEGKADGFYLVADDVVGGFYAINGGSLGDELKNVYYFAPDTLGWESMGRGYTDFLAWAITADLDGFYESLRWPGWEHDVAALHGDQAFFFYPPLFTREGRQPGAHRAAVLIEELWALQMKFLEEMWPPPE